VGSGNNATVLHYVRNDQKLAEGELVLIDAGCELEGYASDVTRTYPVGGRFSGPARALYEACGYECRDSRRAPDAAAARAIGGPGFVSYFKRLSQGPA